MHVCICRSSGYCEAQPASSHAQMFFKDFLAHSFMQRGILRMSLQEELQTEAQLWSESLWVCGISGTCWYKLTF